MNVTNIKKALLSVALVLAGMLGISVSAHALLVSGRWDPAYGVSFSGLGWNGTAAFEIDGTCASPAGCSSSYLVGATVNFYSLLDLAQTTKATLTFAANQPIVTSIVGVGAGYTINTIYTSAGVLTGDATFIAAQELDEFAWGLSFIAGQARMAFNELGDDDDDGDHDQVDNALRKCVFGTVKNKDCGFNDGDRYPAAVTFAPAIPEPGTYALMLAGLAAVGFMARRRRP